MPEATIRELWTYPVKGCQGVAVEAIDVSKLGIPGDRQFAVWCKGELVDQKDTPAIASIAARYEDGDRTLTFSHAKAGELHHTVRTDGERLEAKWVLDQFTTIDQGDAAATWLSEILNEDVRLTAPGDVWKINFPIPQMKLLHDEEKRSFFAASPVALANRASLEDLNRQLDTPAPMDRFRMNVIVDGLEPYQEDAITSYSNGVVQLLQVTPAERCVIVTTDQKTGERKKSDLLKKMRQKPKSETFGSGRIFGSYLQVGKAGTLRVGDRLAIA